MDKSKKDIQKIRDLWQEVKKNVTTDNIKLIRAIDNFEKYIY